MTSLIAAGGSDRSTSVIPAVPAASSVTTIAFMGTSLCRVGSVVDGRHVGVVVACAGGGLEVVQAFELRFGELDLVSRGVLLDASDAAGAGDRGDVVSPGEDPRERGLRGGCADLRADRADLVDEREVAAEVLTGEPRVGLAPVVVWEVVDGADLSGEEAVAERRVGDEPDPELAQQRQDLGL